MQQSVSAVSHRSIVEAFEAVAEEEQFILVTQVAELEQQLNISSKESTSSQLKASLLLDDLDKARRSCKDTEKNQQQAEERLVILNTERDGVKTTMSSWTSQCHHILCLI